MRILSVFFIVLLVSVGVYSQQREFERKIKKGTSRFYNFNVKVGEKIYFLSSSRYDPYAKVFSGAIKSVDSSSFAKDYVLKPKEIQIVVASLVVNSVFISINLDDIQDVIMYE